jgi:hypothetical protein
MTKSNPQFEMELIFSYIESHFIDYPVNKEKDQIFFNILEEDFPDCDLLEEFKTFHAWILDTQLPVNIRSRFRKWLKNSKKWTPSIKFL